MPVAFPPRLFKVDSLTSVATWRSPMQEFVPFEDFEDEQFPPPGWQTFSTYGPHTWLRSNDGGSMYFPIPPGDGYYAVANSDMYGSDYTCSAYLITPQFDLTQTDYCLLEYRSYYTGDFGETATVEYSLDTGNTWTVLHYTPHALEWIYDTVNLTAFTGPSGESSIIIGFYANDHNESGSGWAIDNVWIHGHNTNPQGYFVFLDNQIIDVINHDTNSYTYQGLNWGQTYTGGIEAIYPCRTSGMVEYTWTSSFLYPPQNFHCKYTYGSDEVLSLWNPPEIVATDSNSNLLSFNIYIDDSLFLNHPYQGEPVDDTLVAILDSVEPGLHKIKSTAIYELSNYGFPGQTGESMFSDTATVYLTYGYELPFFEGWDIPDFGFNNWKVKENGATCTIDQHNGTPPASVSIELITDSSEYNTTLTSNPFKADKTVDGEIYLDFDLKLETENTYYDEHFKAEVFNGSRWIEYLDVKTDSSFDYKNFHINITESSKHRVFKIRFSFSGNNCNTNTHWNIDNISVYRECAPPEYFTGGYFWLDTAGQDLFGAKLSWHSPQITPQYYNLWVNWGNLEFVNGALQVYDNSVTVAQRWDKEMFYNWDGLNLDGYTIKKLKIYIGNADTIIGKIWTGVNASELVWCDTLACTANSWNEINVNQPVIIDADKEYWVGYTAFAPTPYIFISLLLSLDDNYGNMVNYEGSNVWETFNFNFAISFFAEDSLSQTGYTVRSFQNFNIYRKADYESDYTLYSTVPFVPDITHYFFYDLYPNVTINNGYSYKVTALWQDDVLCESDFAHVPYYPYHDSVYIFVTGFEENNKSNGLIVYPNPVTNTIHIRSNNKMEILGLYEISGRKIKDFDKPESKQINIDISGIPSGIYVLKIKNGGILTSKKIVVR